MLPLPKCFTMKSTFPLMGVCGRHCFSFKAFVCILTLSSSPIPLNNYTLSFLNKGSAPVFSTSNWILAHLTKPVKCLQQRKCPYIAPTLFIVGPLGKLFNREHSKISIATNSKKMFSVLKR